MLARRRFDPMLLSALLLLALLVVLAAMQYRWVSQVSAAEGERLAASLTIAGERFAADFDRELTRLYLTFLPAAHHGAEPLVERLGSRLDEWNETSPYPELLRDVLVVRPGSEDARVVRLAADGSVEESVADAEIERLLRGMRRRVAPRGHGFGPTLPELPGLLLRAPHDGARAWVVLRLDRSFLEQSLLPELAARHLRLGDRRELAVTVRATPSGEVVYTSGAPIAIVDSAIEQGLYRLRWFPELRARGDALDPDRRERDRRFEGRRRSARFDAGPSPLAGRGPAGWRLLAVPRAGSLEALVERTRRRNLGVSLGILALLAAGVAVALAAARRAQRLARQQIELVAGVTHELYTPLAAIRSAGQNLADGVVTEPEQVRRYGSLVATEGRRLSTMVSRMLELAGLGSGARALAIEAVAPARLVDEALAECRQLLAAKGIEAEVDVPEDLPEVAGDRDALRRALVNLIENAARHGGDGGWIAVRGGVRGEGRRRMLELGVEDRGPGLHPADLPHLFEPFYRGRGVTSQVHGSGLGLALVARIAEAHGGRVRAESGERGARFTLSLPLAEPR